LEVLGLPEQGWATIVWALLLVKYCLWTGKTGKSSQEPGQRAGPEACLAVEDVESLVCFCPGNECLLRAKVAASVVMGSTWVSTWGPWLYGCCFSTATVFADRLPEPC